jgi:hypothetical protein
MASVALTKRRAAAPHDTRLLPYARAIVAELTRSKVIATQVIALSLSLYRYLEFRLASGSVPSSFIGSSVVITELETCSVFFLTLCALEATRRGTSGWLAYPLALSIASLFSGSAQWHVRNALHFSVLSDDHTAPHLRHGHMANIALETSIFGVCFMLAYINRAREVEWALLARAAELRRMQLERDLTHSELAAISARLDPEQVLKDLRRLQSLYASAAPAAAEELNTFVEALRKRAAASAAPQESS